MEYREADQADLILMKRDVKPSSGRTFEDELADQAAGTQSCFLALSENRALGWGFIRWLGPRDVEAARLFPDSPEIYRLEVLAEHRSAGIGRRLIAAMEASAANRGYQSVSLGVDHANTRAYALYRAIGYVDTALTEYFDEYDYPLPGGGTATARDLCRYLVKPFA